MAFLSDVRTSTGSEVFFILKHLDDTKFLSVFTTVETICLKSWAKPPTTSG